MNVHGSYPNLNPKECREYAEKFVEVAGSEDRSVEIPACATIFYAMGWDKRRFDEETIKNWMGSSNDCQISLGNFLSTVSQRETRDIMEAKIRRNFTKMDDNGDGEVTMAEAEEYFRLERMNHSKDKIAAMFRGIDADGNNTISLDEFLKAFLPPPF